MKKGQAALVFALVGLIALAPFSGTAREILPKPEKQFHGKIGRTYKDSVPDFPVPEAAPNSAPNVILILLDDVGFGQTSLFGGSIQTPRLDSLGKGGLRYNQFHTTALCSPTRAALLTGRNHHSVGVGTIAELATGYPGYTGIMPKSAATVAEILRQNGYNTSCFGKWHLTPLNETSMAGPFDRWPTGMGFEYFYGFLGADTSQWEPALVENTTPVEKKGQSKGYHLTTDLADKAISWIRYQESVAPQKPFFLYFSTGACHAPHHVAENWVQKYKGKFDQGWEKYREETFDRQKNLGVIPSDAKLTPRPEEIPAWDTLTDDQKRLSIRMMEIYAGFLEHTDHEIGRVIDSVAQLGELDNTLIIYVVGDNGASAEGGLNGLANELSMANGVSEAFDYQLSMINRLGSKMTYNHYPAGWAWAGSTPFQWVKQVASHFGGTRNPVVMAWPERINDKDGLRTQFHHVIDIMPTILEAAAIEQPLMVNGVPQKPIEGVSMVYSFDGDQADSSRKTQYFEMLGNRGIYHDGWTAVARHGRLPWQQASARFAGFNEDVWELYDIQKDFSQADDLAKQYPKKLRELRELWWAEAGKYNVLPLDDRLAERMDASNRPSLKTARTSFSFYPGLSRLTEANAPDLKNTSHHITAEVVIPKGDVEGILATQGGRYGGWSFFIQDGRPVYVYNFLNMERFTVTSSERVKPGKAVIRYAFAFDGGKKGSGGTGRLFINGRAVGEGRIERTIPFILSIDEGFDIGEDSGTPVTESYEVPFHFTGKLENVTIELK